MNIYIYMNHFAVHLKLTPYYKSTILQLFKNCNLRIGIVFSLFTLKRQIIYQISHSVSYNASLHFNHADVEHAIKNIF